MRLNTMKLSSVLIMLLIYTKSNKEPQLATAGWRTFDDYISLYHIIVVFVAMTLMGVHLVAVDVFFCITY